MPQHMAAASELSVMDVYDLAATIGQEFEKLIENHGPETITDLMPKVIFVLEQLEILTSRNQKENAEVQELRLTVERLEADKAAKAEERARFEKELEQIEDSWQAETKQLVDSIGRLQEENRKVKHRLCEKEGIVENLQSTEQEELQMLTDIKKELDTRRHEVRTLDRELKQKSLDVEALQQQLERMAKLNVDYRRKTALTQQRAQSLIQEKADLQSQLYDKEQQVTQIHHRLMELSTSESPPGSPLSPEDQLTLAGKMVIDLSDPNRPRFTMNELKTVLVERNDLKTKLIEVEEELKHYKPVEELRQEEEEEERPVQGPINREPYEKLYPGKSESGIRKLLSFLTGNTKKKKHSMDKG